MKKIGQGAAAEIFLLENNDVLKLFHQYEGVSEWADRELTRHQLIEKSGLPVPHIKKTTLIEGRPGIIFENLGKGKSLQQAVWSQPFSFFKHAALFGELLAKIHSAAAPELPSQKAALLERLENASGISDGLKSAALEKIANHPEGTRLCHGDFYLTNVLILSGKAFIIDWSEAVKGEPALDLACSFLMLEKNGLSQNRSSLGIRQRIRSAFINTALEQYQKYHKITRTEIQQWEIPAALFLGLNPWTIRQRELLLFAERKWKNENH